MGMERATAQGFRLYSFGSMPHSYFYQVYAAVLENSLGWPGDSEELLQPVDMPL
jgi:hypothetical protein